MCRSVFVLSQACWPEHGNMVHLHQRSNMRFATVHAKICVQECRYTCHTARNHDTMAIQVGMQYVLGLRNEFSSINTQLCFMLDSCSKAPLQTRHHLTTVKRLLGRGAHRGPVPYFSKAEIGKWFHCRLLVSLISLDLSQLHLFADEVADMLKSCISIYPENVLATDANNK